jgi:hypothetical protein
VEGKTQLGRVDVYFVSDLLHFLWVRSKVLFIGGLAFDRLLCEAEYFRECFSGLLFVVRVGDDVCDFLFGEAGGKFFHSLLICAFLL